MTEEMDVYEEDREDVVKIEENNLHHEAISFWVSSKLRSYQLKKTWYLADRELQLEYFKGKHATKLKLMKKRHSYQLKMAQRKKFELKLKHMAEKHYLILNHIQYLKINQKKHYLWEKYMDQKLEVLNELSDTVAKLRTK